MPLRGPPGQSGGGGPRSSSGIRGGPMGRGDYGKWCGLLFRCNFFVEFSVVLRVGARKNVLTAFK